MKSRFLTGHSCKCLRCLTVKKLDQFPVIKFKGKFFVSGYCQECTEIRKANEKARSADFS